MTATMTKTTTASAFEAMAKFEETAASFAARAIRAVQAGAHMEAVALFAKAAHQAEAAAQMKAQYMDSEEV